MTPRRTPVPLRPAIGLAAATLLLSACAAPAPSAGTPTPTPDPATQVGGNSREGRSQTTRLLFSHDNGLTLIDATSGEVVQETAHPGFLRLNKAGDGRHVVVTDGDRFLVYDAGVRSRPHGDHAHHYTYTPGLTATEYAAPHAGHVVAHNAHTALFSDGTGALTIVDSEWVADPDAPRTELSTDAPHHGVAVPLRDDAVLVTQGTEQSRSTVQVRRGDQIIAHTDDCPGVHGEATAQSTSDGDTVLLGCTNGPVVWRDGAFHKVSAPDAYARTGNAAGSPVSPIVLTDYKSDAQAKQEHPTRVALVDTRTNALSLVELGSSYWFRSLARGPHGEALVLTYDGAVKIINPESGAIEASIPAIGPWSEKADWQEAGPSITVAGDTAYVTDAQASSVTVIDLHSRAVSHTLALGATPIEVAVVNGMTAEEEADQHDHAHG